MTAPQPETLTLDRLETPIGPLLIAVDDDGRLRAVDFHDDEAGMRRVAGIMGAVAVTAWSSAAATGSGDGARAKITEFTDLL